jgi:hypothetical protein
MVRSIFAAVAVLSSIAGPVAAQPVKGAPEDATSGALWRAYAADLADFVLGPNADVHGLSLLTVLETIDTGASRSGNYDRITNWCDPIPAYLPVYTRSGLTLSGTYGNYLQSLSYPNVPKEKRKQIDDLRAGYLKSTEIANKLEKRVGNEWADFAKSEVQKPPNRRTSYDVWYSREWGAKVGAAEADVPVKASSWASALTSAFGGYQNATDALLAYENNGYKAEAESQSGLIRRLLSCSIGSANALTTFVTSGDANKAAGKFAYESTLTTDKGQKTVDKWSVSARGGWGGYFGGRASGERTKITEDDRKFSMAVRFRNLTRLAINRDWYRPDVVAVVNEPAQFVNGGIVNPEKLWGLNGVWRLTPTQIIVGYKPSLTITLSTKDYDYAFSKWKAGAGVAIGSFWIGGEGTGSKEKTTWDKQAKTLTVDYDTPDVYVLAVLSSFMPKSKPAP